MSNSEQLYNLIKEAFLLLDDGDQKLVGQFNLSVRRYYTLFWIGKEPGISFSELSQHMLVDKSSVTRIIKALEKDGYVIREAHETDGRSTRLFLTDRGKALQEQATIAHKDSVEHRFDVVGQPSQSSLIALLQDLNQQLRLALNDLEMV
jgi:DNA-binding MarR family transcriptional regulator